MFYFALLLFNVIFAHITYVTCAHNLPALVPQCCIKDPKLNDCISKSLNSIKPNLQEGFKEMKLPSVDPFVFPTFDAKQNTQYYNVTVQYQNTTIGGLSTYQIKSLTYDPQTMKFRGEIQFHPITLDVNFKIQGDVYSFTFGGGGSVSVDLGPLNVTLELSGELVKRKGEEYFNPKNAQVKMDIGDMVVHFENVFGGNQEFARFANDYLHENFKGIMYETKPAFENLAGTLLMRYFKPLGKALPYKKYFPCPE